MKHLLTVIMVASIAAVLSSIAIAAHIAIADSALGCDAKRDDTGKEAEA